MELKTFYDLVDMINDHDLPKIRSVLTDDHVLADSCGNVFTGKDIASKVWKTWFDNCPDLSLEIRDIFRKPGSIAAFGFAGGTIQKDNHHNRYHKSPCGFKAIFREGMVKSWHMTGESLPGFRLMAFPFYNTKDENRSIIRL